MNLYTLAQLKNRITTALLGLLVVSCGGTDGSPSNTPCTNLYAQYPLTFVSGTLTHNEAYPALPKPAKGLAMREETYGTCRVRATDHKADDTVSFARNDYSRRQAFNANSTKFLVTDSDGNWWVYDALTFEKIKNLTPLGGDAEAQWDATDPDILYYFNTNGVGLKINRLAISTLTSTVAADLSARIKAIWPSANAAWTKSEGSPSSDNRYWALTVDDGDWNGLGMITYDLQTDTVLGSYDYALHAKGRPDHLSISPTGTYVVVSWDDGPMVFNRDLSNGRAIATRGEHSDVALDASGNDVYVSIDYDETGTDANNGYVYFRNLSTLARTDLFPTYIDGSATAMHFSGKAFAKPGWIVWSTYGDSGSKQWLHRKVFAVKLAANPTVYQLAHTHQIDTGYFAEPQASVNRDFTKILFNSNWNLNSETDIDAYLIELPVGAIQ